MAQLPGGDRLRYSGLYAELADREERAAATHNGMLVNREAGTSYTGYPERLAAVRAGCSIDLPVGDLPPHARVGLDDQWCNRATVSPDGAITLSVDNGRLWAAENGV